MWVQHTSNYICNYLDQYQIQKKHIERVLSAREHINNTKPYYPKFLQLRLGKNQMEEEKNLVIRRENKNLYYKIESAIIKPSKYSRIFEPKDCPSFNKKMIGLKRIKKEIENYKENVRFYNQIEKVKSFYDNNEINKRNKEINKNIKNIQKSLLELQPSLLFLSPHTVKGKNKKIRYINFNKCKTKRCNSCCNRYEPKKIINDIKNLSRTNRQRKRCYDIKTDMSNQLSSYQKININDKIKKILINPIKNRSKNKKSKSTHIRNKNKKDKNIKYIKKITSSYDNYTKCTKDNNKTKKIGLKRNKSEFNIFN